MSFFKGVVQEVLKLLTIKTAAVIVSICAIGFSSLSAHYKIEKTNQRVDILETEIRNSTNDKIKSFLRDCPIFTGIAWMQYNKLTNELLFRSVMSFDDIDIHDSASQNDLYENQFVDKETFKYFTWLEDGEVSFMDIADEKWKNAIFGKIRAGAWIKTNERIQKNSSAEHQKWVRGLVGDEFIRVTRMYNTVIKDKKNNIIYVLSLAMSNSNIACFDGNKELTEDRFINLANIVKHNSGIA